MVDPLRTTIGVALAGMEAQSTRLRVVAENMANAEATGRTPGELPYTRKVVGFENAFDEALGTDVVRAAHVSRHRSPYRVEHMPGHPAADASGFVKLPNVDIAIEAADMREANRSYMANLHVVRRARELISMTIDLMRGP